MDAYLYPILHNLAFGILIIVAVRFYYRRLHPKFAHPRSAGSILYGLLGSLGVTFGAVLILNAIVWMGVWGNSIEVLFTERNVLVYLISLCFALIVSIGYLIRL